MRPSLEFSTHGTDDGPDATHKPYIVYSRYSIQISTTRRPFVVSGIRYSYSDPALGSDLTNIHLELAQLPDWQHSVRLDGRAGGTDRITYEIHRTTQEPRLAYTSSYQLIADATTRLIWCSQQ